MIKKRQNIIDEELLYQHDIKNLDYSVLISLPMKTTTVQEHLLQSYETPHIFVSLSYLAIIKLFVSDCYSLNYELSRN